MENKYVWATEDIYESDQRWEEEFNKLSKVADFSEYKGKLSNILDFIRFLKADEEVSRVLDKLSVYAMMNHDKDTKNSVYDRMVNKVSSLASELATNTAFVVPELTSMTDEQLKEYASDERLKEYSYFIKRIIDKKKHVLSEKEERLMALSAETASSFREIFTKIDNADLPLSEFTYKGEKYPLTHGTYGVYMHSQDRGLRKKAFTEYYKAYVSLINTVTSTYYGNVKKDVFYAKARGYESSLHMALSNEDVPESVYENLISSVRKSLPLLHKYVRIKKKQLGFKKLRTYDMYCPMVKDAEIELEYEDAYKLVVDGLSVLGNEYGELLKKAKTERWIDVYESDAKRSGAYSVCVYDTHPYVLLNYQKTTHDVFTIAHEMGHSLHSYYSNKNQPYPTADYKIFVAEVASTVNEVLLVKHMLKTAKSDKLKKYLLSYLLEMIRTTLYRQTMFAEFEAFTHQCVEKGEPLTKDMMCEKYLALNVEYYGKGLTNNDEIKYEWARIPHFYRSFYVYKYATGIISALSIVERIMTEGEPAVKDYFRFLSSGGEKSPCELLKLAGVDLTNKKTFERAFKIFKDAIEDFTKI